MRQGFFFEVFYEWFMVFGQQKLTFVLGRCVKFLFFLCLRINLSDRYYCGTM
jgi:hypothetical protein